MLLFTFTIYLWGGGVTNNKMGKKKQTKGQAYAGLGLCEPGWPNDGYREYIEVKLLDTLKTGKVYYVEFWVSLTRFCMNPVPICVDGVGVFFSNDTLKYSIEDTSQVFNVIPQVHNPIGNIIYDTTNWVKISGWFIAEGGEDYMTIGNFIRDENLHIYYPPNNGNYAYVYIDDVSVVECDTTSPLPIIYPIVIYPNPAEDEFAIESKGNTELITFDIFNDIGQIVYKGSMVDKVVIQTTNFAKGMYVIRLNNAGHWEYRKLVKE